jgi:signal transduction histidine kinase
VERRRQSPRHSSFTTAAVTPARPISGVSGRGMTRQHGTGFDTTKVRLGSGLQGIADRLAALDGTLYIHSQPDTEPPSAASFPCLLRTAKDKEHRPR